MDRSHLLTEQRLAAAADLDALSTADALALFDAENQRCVAAVAAVRDDVAKAVDLVAARLARGGRLVYFGAGTSGRLGVLDASECPPTFRSEPGQVRGVIAGGPGAMFQPVEGAEDDADAGARAVDQLNLNEPDVAFGIAAGGTTPFVRGALARATARGAATVFLACVAPGPGQASADVEIRPLVGPEVVNGSTRLKAGTATKLVLNSVTTLAFVRLGKTHGDLMVDLRATNAKLWDRGTRLVATLVQLDRADARALLERAGGHVKVAVVMGRRGTDPDAARAMLDNACGSLRRALEMGA